MKVSSVTMLHRTIAIMLVLTLANLAGSYSALHSVQALNQAMKDRTTTLKQTDHRLDLLTKIICAKSHDDCVEASQAPSPALSVGPAPSATVVAPANSL